MKNYVTLKLAFVRTLSALLVFALLLCGAWAGGITALADSSNQMADRFILLVQSLEDTHDLDERIELLQHAKSADIYYDDISYPGISEALAELSRLEGEILAARQDCDAFIAAVDTAVMTDKSNYPELKCALDTAKSLLGKIDTTYDGIAEARLAYLSLRSELEEKEMFTEEFVSLVAGIANYSSYRERNEEYTRAVDYMNNEKYLPDYAGAKEAASMLIEVSESLKLDIKAANVFISAVARIGTGESMAHDLISAYSALLGIDRTVDGVESSFSILTDACSEYNAEVEKINNDFSNL